MDTTKVSEKTKDCSEATKKESHEPIQESSTDRITENKASAEVMKEQNQQPAGSFSKSIQDPIEIILEQDQETTEKDLKNNLESSKQSKNLDKKPNEKISGLVNKPGDITSNDQISSSNDNLDLQSKPIGNVDQTVLETKSEEALIDDSELSDLEIIYDGNVNNQQSDTNTVRNIEKLIDELHDDILNPLIECKTPPISKVTEDFTDSPPKIIDDSIDLKETKDCSEVIKKDSHDSIHVISESTQEIQEKNDSVGVMKEQSQPESIKNSSDITANQVQKITELVLEDNAKKESHESIQEISTEEIRENEASAEVIKDQSQQHAGSFSKSIQDPIEQDQETPKKDLKEDPGSSKETKFSGQQPLEMISDDAKNPTVLVDNETKIISDVQISSSDDKIDLQNKPIGNVDQTVLETTSEEVPKDDSEFSDPEIIYDGNVNNQQFDSNKDKNIEKLIDELHDDILNPLIECKTPPISKVTEDFTDSPPKIIDDSIDLKETKDCSEVIKKDSHDSIHVISESTQEIQEKNDSVGVMKEQSQPESIKNSSDITANQVQKITELVLEDNAKKESHESIQEISTEEIRENKASAEVMKDQSQQPTESFSESIQSSSEITTDQVQETPELVLKDTAELLVPGENIDVNEDCKQFEESLETKQEGHDSIKDNSELTQEVTENNDSGEVMKDQSQQPTESFSESIQSSSEITTDQVQETPELVLKDTAELLVPGENIDVNEDCKQFEESLETKQEGHDSIKDNSELTQEVTENNDSGEVMKDQSQQPTESFSESIQNSNFIITNQNQETATKLDSEENSEPLLEARDLEQQPLKKITEDAENPTTLFNKKAEITSNSKISLSDDPLDLILRVQNKPSKEVNQTVPETISEEVPKNDSKLSDPEIIYDGNGNSKQTDTKTDKKIIGEIHDDISNPLVECNTPSTDNLKDISVEESKPKGIRLANISSLLETNAESGTIDSETSTPLTRTLLPPEQLNDSKSTNANDIEVVSLHSEEEIYTNLEESSVKQSDLDIFDISEGLELVAQYSDDSFIDEIADSTVKDSELEENLDDVDFSKYMVDIEKICKSVEVDHELEDIPGEEVDEDLGDLSEKSGSGSPEPLIPEIDANEHHDEDEQALIDSLKDDISSHQDEKSEAEKELSEIDPNEEDLVHSTDQSKKEDTASQKKIAPIKVNLASPYIQVNITHFSINKLIRLD